MGMRVCDRFDVVFYIGWYWVISVGRGGVLRFGVECILYFGHVVSLLKGQGSFSLSSPFSCPLLLVIFFFFVQ